MKNGCWYIILWIFLLLTSIAFCKDLDSNTKHLPSFSLFIEPPGCAGCTTLPINNIINNIEKKFPDATLQIYVKIPDSSLITSAIYKCIKAKNINYIIDEPIIKKLNLKSYPTLIMFNFHNDEIYRYERANIDSFSIQKLKKLLSNQIINETNAVSIKYPIVKPQVQSFFIKDNKMSYVDIMQNEIGVIDLKTGDSIKTISPDSTLIKSVLKNLEEKDLEWLSGSLFPIIKYKSAIPLGNDEFICKAYLVTGFKSDTVTRIINSLEQKSGRRVMQTKAVNLTVKGDTTYRIDSTKSKYNVNEPYRLKSNKYLCHISLPSKASKENDILDTTYLLAESYNPLLIDVNPFLSLGLIKKVYNWDSVRYIYSIGLVDYNNISDEYYYMNPWLKVFLSYNKKNNIAKKIKPKGLLAFLFEISADFFESNNITTGALEDFYLYGWGLANEAINILIVPHNNDKSSEYFVIQKYDYKCNFISEDYYSYKDNDKIFRVDFISDYDNNNSYLLIQSKKRHWQLIKLS